MNTVQTLWDKSPRTCHPADYRGQVGMTVYGHAISDDQFCRVLSEISGLLSLKQDDVLLDLCCGNGLITNNLARKCRGAVGVDFSRPLLDVALRDHTSENVEYRFMSVLDENAMRSCGDHQFNKVLLYTALQFFSHTDFAQLLKNIMPLVEDDFIMLIGNIPDRQKRAYLYDTPLKKIRHRFRKIIGTEHLKFWWTKEELQTVCSKFGLTCDVYDQDDRMYNSHFRFDAVVSKCATRK